MTTRALLLLLAVAVFVLLLFGDELTQWLTGWWTKVLQGVA